MANSPEYPDLPWVEPRSWSQGRTAGNPRVIVIHTTEGHEGFTAAEDGAAYDARRIDGTSTHYFHDPNSTIQCVRTTDRAHAARRNGNNIGIQHELCGRAGQTDAQWDDSNSNAIIRRAAKQAARDCRKWGIPVVRLTPSRVRAGEKGFCGHVDITHAYPEDNGSHTDPGPQFPWAEFLDAVRAELGEDMPLTVEDAKLVATWVLGRKPGVVRDEVWGRSLAPSIDALILASAKAATAEQLAEVLAAINADPGNSINLGPEQVAELAMLIAHQLPNEDVLRVVVDQELDEAFRGGADAD